MLASLDTDFSDNDLADWCEKEILSQQWITLTIVMY